MAKAAMVTTIASTPLVEAEFIEVAMVPGPERIGMASGVTAMINSASVLSFRAAEQATPERVAHLLWLRLDHHFIIMRLASASAFT
jgi:hypothetical protein